MARRVVVTQLAVVAGVLLELALPLGFEVLRLGIPLPAVPARLGLLRIAALGLHVPHAMPAAGSGAR
uniref:Uncharacterized protein n=1 Tax=Thermocrispum agreste TaxID=37925 RepID=A0A2W4L0Q1_9PSEU|nr:MAG: hypothetical protein DIU77_14060 [Thermocrispum agreste]